jgi:uncharacterized protein (TIGR00661 family)
VNQVKASLKILVAPLDWGLGHATRCIPIIKVLLQQGCTVVLAASGKEKHLLQEEFPQLKIFTLPGYKIQYASTAWGLPLKIVAQIPRLFAAIKKEHAWLHKVVEEEGIQAVISDNRFGLYHATVPCVFVTHQLRIKASLKCAEDFLQRWNYRYINRFTECWVPDAKGKQSLAGELSHPFKKPAVPLYYTGPLSRFRNTAQEEGNDLLIILSGPEPQRTLFEQIIVKDLQHYTGQVTLVRGLPGETAPLLIQENVAVFNHLSAAQLQEKIQEAGMVVSRCGYSTVMDLCTLQKRSILVPTPGQTEQIYLAKHLMKKNIAFCVEQHKFRLKNVLQAASQFRYVPYNLAGDENLENVVRRLVDSLSANKKQ